MRNMKVHLVKCPDCGTMFESKSYSPTALCNECRKRHKKEVNRRYESWKFPERKPRVKRTETCCVCGGPFSCMYDGKPYCNKHWLRMYNNGTIEPKQRERTNKYYAFGGVVCVVAADGRDILIDKEDFPNVSKYSWCINRGYPVANIKGKVTRISRFLLDPTAGMVIDHINGDPTDNRRCNLRACTPKENARNARKPRSNESGTLGVSKTSTGRYRARIMVDRKEVCLGIFDTIDEAKRARQEGELKYYGEFAPCLGVNKFTLYEWVEES